MSSLLRGMPSELARTGANGRETGTSERTKPFGRGFLNLRGVFGERFVKSEIYTINYTKIRYFSCKVLGFDLLCTPRRAETRAV